MLYTLTICRLGLFVVDTPRTKIVVNILKTFFYRGRELLDVSLIRDMYNVEVISLR
jgi:hypothetical protein